MDLIDVYYKNMEMWIKDLMNKKKYGNSSSKYSNINRTESKYKWGKTNYIEIAITECHQKRIIQNEIEM